MAVKAISLLSGGLDSILATKLIMEHGVEVVAVNFMTMFCTCTTKNSSSFASKYAADNLGVPLKVFEVTEEIFDIVKKPAHGYGRNLNPCLDCRIFIFRTAGEYMRKTGASFLVTGEVLGERPMSQRRDAIRVIERDSGMDGFIVRPLSAKLLPPSIPEMKGWVNREKFMDIHGRSRKPQIQLAKELGINDYPSPAGGCLLTDPGFAKRMKDLIDHKKDFVKNDVGLLKVGRHFRLSNSAKLVVGRNEAENDTLLKLSKEDDFRFDPVGVKGPVGIGRGLFTRELVLIASRMLARYCDSGFNEKIMVLCEKGGRKEAENYVLPMDEPELKECRI